MRAEWIITNIGSIVDTNIDTYSKKDKWSFVNYLDTGNITENRITKIQHLVVGKDKIPSRAKRKVKTNDIIFSTVRPNQKHYGKIKKPFKNMLVSTGFTTLRVKKNGLDIDFIYWFITQPKIINHLQMIGEHTASTYPSIKPSDIESLEISLPPFEEQKAISFFLNSLDDKIELNRQTNKTLEAMAQALFKSWFVDFDPVIDNALAAGNPIPEMFAERAKLRAAAKNMGSQSDSESAINGASNYQHLFPAEFEFTEEMGWIPLGWNTCEVGDQLVRLKVKKRYTKNDAISYGKTPIYEQGVNILLGYHNEDPDLNATMESPIFIFGDHTCVTKLSIEPFSISANVIPLQGKDYPTTWVYYAVKDKQKFEEYRRHWMELIIKPLLLPSKELSNIFVTFAQEVKSREKHVERQNSELTKLRNTLLPKLLSGELRIPDAEKLIAEADV